MSSDTFSHVFMPFRGERVPMTRLQRLYASTIVSTTQEAVDCITTILQASAHNTLKRFLLCS
jgi:hypothetical protein